MASTVHPIHLPALGELHARKEVDQQLRALSDMVAERVVAIGFSPRMICAQFSDVRNG